MNLSQTGGVAVIDDNYGEVAKLLALLSKSGIPYYYFDGKPQNMPEGKIDGIRFIFLDIEFDDTRGLDEKNIASTLAMKITTIVGNEHTPYFIFFWTKHEEVIEAIIRYLNTKNPPIGYCNAEKPTIPSTDTIEKISDRIGEGLKKAKAFEFFIMWENMIKKAMARYVDSFSEMNSDAGNRCQVWSDDISKTLAFASKKLCGESDDNGEIISGAMQAFNNAFADIMHVEANKIDDFKKCNFDLTEIDTEIDIEKRSRLNSSLFFDFRPAQKLQFGSVFLHCQDLHTCPADAIIAATFKEQPQEITPCSVIITPQCDLANNKTLIRSSEVIHRIISGIIFPWNKSKKELNTIKLSRAQDARFDIGPFFYNDKPHYMILHFGALRCQRLRESIEPKFCLNRELAFDLQSKTANHVNRLGNSLFPLPAKTVS